MRWWHRGSPVSELVSFNKYFMNATFTWKQTCCIMSSSISQTSVFCFAPVTRLFISIYVSVWKMFTNSVLIKYGHHAGVCCNVFACKICPCFLIGNIKLNIHTAYCNNRLYSGVEVDAHLGKEEKMKKAYVT